MNAAREEGEERVYVCDVLNRQGAQCVLSFTSRRAFIMHQVMTKAEGHTLRSVLGSAVVTNQCPR
eukprot:10430850-Lingulodinium_polyedra.AAC.1